MTYSVVTVNAGHSAKAPGASGCGYKEHEVARQLKTKLIHALNAVDTTSDAGDKNAVLAEQVRKCNAVPKANRLDVAIHLNAGGGTGTEVLYFGDSTKALAAKVSAAIAKAGGYRDRGAKERKDLYFLRNTNAPAILIEVCFIDNAEDMRKLMANTDAIIDAIVTAITGKVMEKASKDAKVVFEGKSVPALIQDGRTYVQIRELADLLGLQVGWNQQSSTVTLSKGADK